MLTIVKAILYLIGAFFTSLGHSLPHWTILYLIGPFYGQNPQNSTVNVNVSFSGGTAFGSLELETRSFIFALSSIYRSGHRENYFLIQT